MPPTQKPTPDQSDPRPDASSPPKFDAKKHLERTLVRQPGDILKIVPIPHTHSFRANWYAARPALKSAIPGLTLTYIRDSQFLFCRLDPTGTPQITYPQKQ